MKPSDILDAAANIILRDGHHKGTYYAFADVDDPPEVDAENNRTAPCCQLGAINRAVYGMAWINHGQQKNPAKKLARARADQYMRAYVERVHRVSSSICWNDQSTTTKEDVVAALRGAADDAREAGE